MGKGSLFDVIILGVTMLVLAIGILIGSLVMTQIQTSTSSMLTSAGAQAALQAGTDAINTFNYGFVIIVIGGAIGSLILAWMVPSHPIFMLVSVIMLLLSVVVLPILANTYETFASTSEMASAAASFPLMNLLMSNMPLIGVVFGVMMMIVLYTRYNTQGTA